jgi:hypothetical protein
MTEATRGYRELIAWQKAMQLVPAVYRLVRQLPAEERYALSDQLRRAVVSIPANIAEGQARQHAAEFAQHLAIARGSGGGREAVVVLESPMSRCDPHAHPHAHGDCTILHNPNGLIGDFCEEFLRNVRFQGSGVSSSGTPIQIDYSQGDYRASFETTYFHVVPEITGAAGRVVTAGSSIAVDRAVILRWAQP